MRFLHFFVFIISCLFSNYVYNIFSFDCGITSSSRPLSPHYLEYYRQIPTQRSCNHLCQNMNQNDFTVVKNFYDAARILIFGVFILLRLLLLNLSTHVNYVKFNTDLNIFSKKKHYPVPTQITLMYLYVIFAGLHLCEYKKDIILISIIRIYPFFGSDPFDLPLKNITTVSRVISVTSPFYMFSISVTPVTYFLCLLVFQVWCYSYIKNVP